MSIDRRITLDKFLGAFRQQNQEQENKPFCFILGAGASKPSNIRTNGELALEFLRDLGQSVNRFAQRVPGVAECKGGPESPET